MTRSAISRVPAVGRAQHCFYCRVPLLDAQGTRLRWNMRTADHLDQQQDGGLTTRANLVPCCYLCNQLRNVTQLSWQAYRQYLQSEEGRARYRAGKRRLRVHGRLMREEDAPREGGWHAVL